MLLLELAESFKKNDVKYAIAGGYALALHGAVRGTVDIDLVLALDKQNLNHAVTTLTAMGLVSRLPITANEVYEFRQEYIQKRNLIGWNFYDPKDPSRLIDLIITHDLNSMESIPKRIGKIDIPVVGINDLIAMKKQAGRPQDLIDIAALERIQK